MNVMNLSNNPLLLVVYGVVIHTIGQLFFALIRHDLGSIRDHHFWLNHPSINKHGRKQDLRRLSANYLPGALVLLGGLPQAFSLTTSLATLIYFRFDWWTIILLPAIVIGSYQITCYILRAFVKKYLINMRDKPPPSLDKPLGEVDGK
jgi:hypothetical protein